MAGGPVRVVARAAGGAVRHAAWWLRYRLNGQTRPMPPAPPRRNGRRGSHE